MSTVSGIIILLYQLDTKNEEGENFAVNADI